MDTEKLKNNTKFTAWWPERDIIISLKESPEFNLHIWNGYVETIVSPPIFTDKDWVGFTRDYQESKGAWAWDEMIETKNVDEYIWDMLQYKDKKYEPIWEKMVPEVFNLILDFLTYAKQTGQTVIMEMD